MTAGSARQKRLRARQRNGEVVVPVVVSNEMIGELLDRGWLPEAESEDRERIGAAIADMLADFANLPMKNSVTRHGRAQSFHAFLGQTKRESDR